MSNHEQKSVVPLHPGELRALHTAIGSYLNYLRNVSQPSRRRDTLMTVLQGVCMRLTRMLSLGKKIEGEQLWLTDIEVWAIDVAMLAFCRGVRLVVESSQQRDETLRELDKVRVRIKSLLLPSLN